MKASNCLILAIFEAFGCLFHLDLLLNFLKLEHYYGWLKYEWNGFDEDSSINVLCCLISNFEAFRLINLEVLEALLLIKKLLIKNWMELKFSLYEYEYGNHVIGFQVDCIEKEGIVCQCSVFACRFSMDVTVDSKY